MLRQVEIGERVQLRKKHPCGSYEWRVVRLGADIGIKCLGCGRRVLLERRSFERRVKAFLPRDTAEGAGDFRGPNMVDR